MLLEPSQKIC